MRTLASWIFNLRRYCLGLGTWRNWHVVFGGTLELMEWMVCENSPAFIEWCRFLRGRWVLLCIISVSTQKIIDDRWAMSELDSWLMMVYKHLSIHVPQTSHAAITYILLLLIWVFQITITFPASLFKCALLFSIINISNTYEYYGYMGFVRWSNNWSNRSLYIFASNIAHLLCHPTCERLACPLPCLLMPFAALPRLLLARGAKSAPSTTIRRWSTGQPGTPSVGSGEFFDFNSLVFAWFCVFCRFKNVQYVVQFSESFCQFEVRCATWSTWGISCDTRRIGKSCFLPNRRQSELPEPAGQDTHDLKTPRGRVTCWYETVLARLGSIWQPSFWSFRSVDKLHDKTCCQIKD